MREVAPGDTAALRRAVLRDGRDHPPLGDEPGDGAVHLAAYDGALLVAAGSVRPDGPGRWRVRGMATLRSHRGRGAGSQVLDALVALVEARGGGLVWCHARTGARTLYERAGFVTVGAPWVDADIGPHVEMQRPT